MKGKNLIIVILSLLVIVMGGYLVYDKVLEKDIENKEESNNVEKNEDNNKDDNSLIVKNTSLDKYKNVDGSYGFFKNLTIKTPFYIKEEQTFKVKLSLDGNVYIYDTEGNVINNIELNNVIDIIEFSEDPSAMSDLYFLTADGYVYIYKGIDLLDKKYSVTKIENVNDVNRLIEVNYCPWEGSGCAWELVAITNDKSYVSLGHGSV